MDGLGVLVTARVIRPSQGERALAMVVAAVVRGGGGRGTMLAVVELRRNPISLQRGEGAGR